MSREESRWKAFASYDRKSVGLSPGRSVSHCALGLHVNRGAILLPMNLVFGARGGVCCRCHETLAGRLGARTVQANHGSSKGLLFRMLDAGKRPRDS